MVARIERVSRVASVELPETVHNFYPTAEVRLNLVEFGNTFAIHPGLRNPLLYRKPCFKEPKILWTYHRISARYDFWLTWYRHFNGQEHFCHTSSASSPLEEERKRSYLLMSCTLNKEIKR